MTNPSWAIFDPDYSAIYDLTTRHRDVEAEVDALARLAGGFCASSAGRILDIGCGTGRHARRLAERGFDSFGVDPSAAMIRRALMPKTGAKFFCCTMEEFLEKDFHFAYSMGHVVNYLQTEEGLISFFRGVCRALGKGGGYYFECWGQEATAADLPKRLVREEEADGLRVRREAIPNVEGMPERVQLLYRMEIWAGEGAVPTVLEKVHCLRLFSRDLLEESLRRSGFDSVVWSPAFTEAAGEKTKFWGALSRKPG